MSGGEVDHAGRDALALARAPAEWRDRVIAALPAANRRELAARWTLAAHAGQMAPAGAWRVWLIRAGRGFGKTRAGAEWVCEQARLCGSARIALVGATLDEARAVMVEGPSGVVAVAAPYERVEWRPTRGEVRFASGAVASVYSAAAPESLRGPEHHFAWADELGKWTAPDAWTNLMMGLRLGDNPRAVVTTTPRPTMLMRRVMAMPAVVETRGRTGDNPHLPAAFVAAMAAEYGGTRLGRQELDGELLDDVVGALWPRALIERQRVGAPPALVRVVVGVDPPAGIGGDACGIVAAGRAEDGRGYVIEDASVLGASPEGWARAVADCVARVGADRVIAEANQGGAMVASVLRAANAGLPLTLVHASRGKVARAEPVAALYESGRVFHAGRFPALEDELAGLSAGGGYEGPGRSPDRADACVWALTHLMLTPVRTGSVAVL